MRSAHRLFISRCTLALTAALISMICVGVLGRPVQVAASEPTERVRCVAIEIYTRSSDSAISEKTKSVQALLEGRRGVRVRVFDLDQDSAGQSRLDKIVSAYRLLPPELPLVYGMNRAVFGLGTVPEWQDKVDELLTMEVFVREGCSRCAKAKKYLPEFQRKYPGVRVQIKEVLTDPAANERYSQLVADVNLGGVSFPGFWMCRRLTVGFDDATVDSPRIETVLKRWTFECDLPVIEHAAGASIPSSWSAWVANKEPLNKQSAHAAATHCAFGTWVVASFQPATGSRAQDGPSLDTPVLEGQDQPELEIDSGESPELEIIPQDLGQSASTGSEEIVRVPWLGSLSAKRLGMPLFTVLIGLVDGFNPCAMWVLLLLLSVVINLRDRRKILAVAGTFVLVSAVAYYAFIAAWLNVLMFVGFLRWVQVLLASLAIVVGSVHIKDFFAFKKGLTFSIPESAKPGIYARIRKIVIAEHLYGALAGAVVLAVLVNMIELLCTAGLPALYSQVLMLQEYPAWKNHAYLGLYILAYMFDDSIMVAVAVVTLGHKRLQETEGRWLKLASGLVIVGLGCVLLFKPQWLV